MTKRIINFIKLLRESNVRISIAESIEACKALQILDITNKQEFKTALRTTLIKQSSDLEVFDKIFDLYFSEPIDKKEKEKLSEQEFEQLMQELQNQMGNEKFEELKEEKSNNNVNDKQDVSEFNNEFQNFDKHKINKDLYKNGSESDIKDMAEKIANSRRYEEWEKEDIEETCQRMMIQHDLEYSKAMAKNETRNSKRDEIEDKYQQLKKSLKEEIEKAMVKQFGKSIIADIVENNNIMDKDLGDLSIDELEKIDDIIKKLAKKLATHISRKEKHAKKGKINIKKTIKSSIKYGNTSSELKFKNKQKKKLELVVLCDISGSVYMYVSFMLQLVIGIQNVFDKVESYIFVDTIKNVTEKILESDNVQKTMCKFMMDSSLGYGTDYGNVFKEFSQEKDLFNKKTVLIIMGDAENTGREVGYEYLKQISDKCKVIYWLDPKDKSEWYSSELKVYEKYCKEVYECSTLRQLEIFIKNLVKI